MSADEEFDWSFPLDRTRASVQESAILESLARRARPGERSEELLFDLGLLDEHDFALEITSRAGRAYAGLRDFVPTRASSSTCLCRSRSASASARWS